MTYHVFIGKEYTYWRPFESAESAEAGIRSLTVRIAYIEVHETTFPDFGLILHTLTYTNGELVT